MSVELSGTVIRILGPGRIEDAEPLAALLLAAPGRAVDLTAAGPLHAAVAQALLAFRPPLLGPAGDPFVQAWLVPLLGGHAAPDAAPPAVAEVADFPRPD